MSRDDTAQNAGSATMERFYEEVINQGDEAAVDRFVAPDFRDHLPVLLPSQPTRGPQALRWFLTQLRTAFPDLHVSVDEVVAAGNRVAVRVTWTGTHRGPFLGTDPTGKRIRVTGMDMVHLAGGRIVEHWGQLDVLTLLEQLGFLPSLDRPMAG